MSDEEVPPEDLPTSVSNNAPDTEVPPEDLPNALKANAGDEVPPEDLPEQALQNQYGSHPVLGGLEAYAKGITGGASNVLASGMRSGASALGIPEEYLHYIAPSPQQLSANQVENPEISDIGHVLGQTTAVTMMPEIKILGSAGFLSKIGSAALDQSLKMMALQSGEETSKYLTGEGDPGSVVASHIIKAGGIGLANGTLYGAGTATASKLLGSANVGNKITSALTGFGHGLAYPAEKAVSLSESMIPEAERAGIDNGMFKIGQKLASAGHGKIASNLGKAGGTMLGGIAGHMVGGDVGTTIGGLAGPFIESALEPYIGKAASKIVGVPILKLAASGRMDSLEDLINYGTCAAKGNNMLSKGIEGLFSSGANQIFNISPSERDRENLKSSVENNSLDQQIQNSSQNYAQGGEVQPQPLQLENGLSQNLPTQNMMLSAAKSRVSNYLGSIRPMANMNKLPFDVDRPNPQKEHDYDKIIDLANQPISILKDIKNGTLTPGRVKAFIQMYPEVHQEMTKKITEHIANKVHNKERPPYHLRQSLSLFMGTNLDSSLSQPNIAAAQAVFMQQKAQQAPPSKTNSLNKASQSSQTPEQSRESRLNKS